jgi:hypothetical protein
MEIIGKIKEVYGIDYAALSELVSDKPMEHKETVLRYLRKVRIDAQVSAAGVFYDALTGDVIPGEALFLTDGKYGWRSDAAYYVGWQQRYFCWQIGRPDRHKFHVRRQPLCFLWDTW